MLRRAARPAAGVLPAALAATLSRPALAALVFLALVVLTVTCWVIANGERTARVSQLLLAWRGNTAGPARDDTVPAVRDGRRYRLGRS